MGSAMKQLADISLFQSLEQGNYPAVNDPFSQKEEVSVHNVDVSLGALARVSNDSMLNSLLEILNSLGTLNIAEKELSKFRAGSIQEVIDAIVFGLGGKDTVKKLLGGKGVVSETKTEKPKPAVQTAVSATDQAKPATKTSAATKPLATNAPEIVAKPHSEEEVEAKLAEARLHAEKMWQLYDEGKVSEEELRKAQAEFDRWDDAYENLK